MKIFFLVILTTILAIFQLSSAIISKNCDELLLPHIKNHSTESFIAYLGQLVETQTIGDSELIALIESIERDSIENPISEEQTWVSTTHLIHRDEIQKYLHDPNLDRQSLLAWAKSAIKEKALIQKHRENVRIITQDVFQKLQFHVIPPGVFKKGDKFSQKQATVTHFIEVMSTPVTQRHWTMDMKFNPSQFSEGKNSISLKIGDKKIRMQPDNPVESITWWSAIVFANRRSEIENLVPAYDLSGVELIDISVPVTKRRLLRSSSEIFAVAARGNLGSLAQKAIPAINAPFGDIELAQGYRLPTDDEQEYLLRGAGNATGDFHFGNDEDELIYYAWHRENSEKTTYPVAELKPMIIGGKEFFDTLGNVSEWSNDRVQNEKRARAYCWVRGGSFQTFGNLIRAFKRPNYDPNSKFIDTGLRLVRTL